MPRWKALPDELDPQIREFTSQLRRLVDRSGMSLAAIADRTEYSKSSWERYLNGRLLAPRGAVQALADVTDTEVRHLATMWELAERAWSRSEMRHDMTMEAVQVAQARAALSPTGETPAKGWKWGLGGKNGKDQNARDEHAPPVAPPPGTVGSAAPATSASAAPAAVDKDTAVMRPRSHRAPRGGAANGRDAGPLASWPPGGGPAPETVDPQSWGSRSTLESSEHPAPTSASAAQAQAQAPAPAPAPARAQAPAPAAPSSSDGGHRARAQWARDDGGGGRRVLMLVAGVVAALVVVAGASFAFDLTGKDESAEPKPTPTAEKKLPAGVKCSDDGCNGKDPETMGCGGQHATTAGSQVVGASTVEVRYSKVCGTVWARVTGGTNGDSLKVSGEKRTQKQSLNGPDAYTPMVPVKDVERARACVTFAAGGNGCAHGTAS